MAVPVLTDLERQEALDKAIECRRTRAKALNDVREGNLRFDSLLNTKNPVLKTIKVQSLLMCLKGIGDRKSRAILQQYHISENRRIRGLGSRQKKRLLEWYKNNY